MPTIDGSLGDWPAGARLDNAQTGTAGYGLYGTADAGYFYFAIASETAPVGQATTLWIDSDLNRATGYQIFGSTGGAEYNVEVGTDGVPRLYSGGPGGTFVADLEHAYSPERGILEFRVARADIGSPDQVRVYADVNDAAFIPNSYASGNLLVGQSPPVVVGGTTIDGTVDPGEWTATELLHDSAPGADPGYRLFGAVEQGAASGSTFVLAIDSAAAPIGANTTIWIDADRNASTGYQIFGSTGGAEYNINIGADGVARLYSGAAGETFVANLDARLSADGTGFEVALPQNILAGNPTAIRVLADVNDQAFLPASYAGSNLVIRPPVDPVDDPQVRIGIVYSETTAANYYNLTNYGQLFMAAQNQAMQAGVPFDVLTEADLLDPANLAKYDALVFPGFSNVRAGQVDAIASSLATAQEAYGVGLIAAGNFLTNDETGAALPGNSYARMSQLLGVTLEGFGQTQGIDLRATGAINPILDGYAAGQLVGEYSNASYLNFTDVTGAGQVLFEQVVTTPNGATATLDAVIATQTGARNVQFATDAILGNNNILGEAIDWVVGDNAPDVSLQMTRGSSLFFSRNDMDQSQQVFDVSGTQPGIYGAMLPIVERWYQDWGFVGSYYVNVGANPPDETTDWAVSRPYYDRIRALESEIGSHSFTHPADTNVLLPDTPEILALVQRVDPRNPNAVDPWTLTQAEQDLLYASYRFQFETSQLIIESRLGIDVVGGAVPGAPENVGATREMIRFFDYLSGGYSGIGAGYPGAFGFLTPGEDQRVYLAPNMRFDFALIGFLGMTPEQATAAWLREYETVVGNATTPIIALPWHDYGPTNWEDNNPNTNYTLAMFEALIGRAAADGAEFVTGADLANRIKSFAGSTLTTSRSGNVVTATVGSAGAGRFALDMGREGTIASVEGWYAYDDNSVFLPRAGGTFRVALGPTPADVTRINDLGQRNELISLAGDGTDLSFTFAGRSDVKVDLRSQDGQRILVTGANDARFEADGDLVLAFSAMGQRSVALDLSTGTAPVNGGAAAEILIGGAYGDVLNGNAGNDVLLGRGGGDTLQGGSGNDRLSGGVGADALLGGANDDTYVLVGSDAAEDTITELAFQGTDTVQADATYALSANLENLVLTGTANLRGTGNAGANRLTGNGGDNVLDGGLGADVMDGGLGADLYYIDNAGDRANEAAGAGTDEIRTTLASLNIGNNGMTNVENLAYVGTASFVGTGNALANSIAGGAGNDSLFGGTGNDVLTGNGGDDWLDGGGDDDQMTGGQGNDTYVVGVAGDLAIEDPGGGTDTVRSAVSLTLAAELENLVLTGSSGLSGTGNAQGNTITGNGGANTLDGGGGADVLIGGGGNDTYVVDNAGDVVTEAAGAGTDTVRTALAALGIEGMANVENLTFVGSGPFQGTGNGGANTLTGGDGADSLLGLGGNDVLRGGDGADSLDGGLGNDSLAGGLGDDLYVFDSTGDWITEGSNQGRDRVLASVTLTLGSNLEDLTLVGAVNGTGNNVANAITGSEQANSISGLGGDDVLTGGRGNDVLTGGAGLDVFVFAPGFGADRVTDFDYNPSGGQDLLDLRAFGIGSAAFASRVSLTDLGADILVTVDGDPNQSIRLANAQAVGNVTIQDFIL